MKVNVTSHLIAALTATNGVYISLKFQDNMEYISHFFTTLHAYLFLFLNCNDSFLCLSIYLFGPKSSQIYSKTQCYSRELGRFPYEYPLSIKFNSISYVNLSRQLIVFHVHLFEFCPWLRRGVVIHISTSTLLTLTLSPFFPPLPLSSSISTLFFSSDSLEKYQA